MKFGNRKRSEHGVTKMEKHLLMPTKTQLLALEQVLETNRRLYNSARWLVKNSWESDQKSLNWIDLKHWLTRTRKGNPYFMAVNRNMLDETLRKLTLAYAAFFRRVKENKEGGKGKLGYPRYKDQEHFNSFVFSRHGNGYKLHPWSRGMRKNRVYIQGVGDVKMWQDRDVGGELKTMTVRREGSKWYACFAVYFCDGLCVQSEGKISVGFDAGLKSFLTGSDGTVIENPKFLYASMKELKRLGRGFSRKDELRKNKDGKKTKKRSANNIRAKERLRKAHEKVANRRKYFAHCLSKQLVGQYGKIAVEDLDVKGMMKKKYDLKKEDRKAEDGFVMSKKGVRGLHRNIGDAGWAMFLSFLEYKANHAGVTFKRVSPRYTTQDCSRCGERVPKTMKVRIHKCPVCGLEMDRDLNAAMNILRRGAQKEVTDILSAARGKINGQVRAKKDLDKQVEKNGWLGIDKDFIFGLTQEAEKEAADIKPLLKEVWKRVEALPFVDFEEVARSIKVDAEELLCMTMKFDIWKDEIRGVIRLAKKAAA
jgi:putative transposase